MSNTATPQFKNGVSWLTDRWKAKIQEADAIRASGKVKISYCKSKIQVVVPYNDDFAKGARELSGTWKHKTTMWSFRAQSVRLVEELAKRVFGEDCMYRKDNK